MPAVDVTAPEPLGLRPDLPPVVPNVLDVGIAPDPTSCHPERPSRAPAPSNDRRSGRSASVDGRWSAFGDFTGVFAFAGVFRGETGVDARGDLGGVVACALLAEPLPPAPGVDVSPASFRREGVDAGDFA